MATGCHIRFSQFEHRVLVYPHLRPNYRAYFRFPYNYSMPHYCTEIIVKWLTYLFG
jgi:hypothetical protein